MDDRPDWARRIRSEREARGWSQPKFVAALRAHASQELPSDASMLRTIRRWEAGETRPDDFYRPLVAKTFGTVTAAVFGPEPGRRDSEAELLSVAGMDTLEIVTRLRTSNVDNATLDGLRVTVDRLCSEYPYLPPETLLVEGRQWLRRITGLLDRRTTLAQHREILALSGMLALLVGCVEYDSNDRNSEATRRAALTLGEESGATEITGWAHEMRAWFSLTRGDYRGVIAAAEAGEAAAPTQGVSVQLAGQRAKAWARLGDRRQTEIALDQGRTLLETLPYPDNLDHHFVVDPAKFDFYTMDCYRLLTTEDRLAKTYASEVLRAGTDVNGAERSPMRNAEARLTLGVVAAREGDVEQAVAMGNRALEGDRKSLPSLLMVSQELADTLADQSADHPAVVEYLDRLRQLRTAA